MRTVLTYGTFDLFHVGHLRLLKSLKDMSGDGRVIVGVSSDEFNERKGKKSLIPFDQRAEIVGAIDCVELVIKENSWDQKEKDVEEYGVDIFAIGDDWTGKFDYLSKMCEVIYLPRTQGVSTTDLKSSLESFISLDPDDVIKTYEVLRQLSKGLR